MNRKKNSLEKPNFTLKWVSIAIAFVLACATSVGAQTIPSTPVLKSPANGIGAQSILEGLSWNTAASATSYEVEISASSSFGTTTFDHTVTGDTALLQNLSASTTYYWQARASDAAGTSVWSTTWSFTTVHYVYDTATSVSMSIALQTSANPTVNGAPLGKYDEVGAISITGLCVGSAIWDSIHSQIIIVVGQDPLSGTPDGLNAGDSIYFRVWHYSTQKEGIAAVTWKSGYATPTYSDGGIGALASLTALTAPDQPILSSPSSGSGSQPLNLTLLWNTAARAVSYAVQVSTNSAFSTTVVNSAGLTSTSYALGGLFYGTIYYWEVNGINTYSVTGAWSGVWSFSTGVNLVIPLVAGWNMKSLNIHPTDSTTGGVFKGLKGFILVKSAGGQQYIPSDGIDQIDTIRTGMGYQIYDDSTDTMRLTGGPVNVALSPISLDSAAWSIIAYLPQVNMPVTTALAGIVSQIVLVKDNAGDQYIPSVGVNTIDSMVVGEGYWIYTSAAATLTYPSSAAKRVAGFKALLSLPEPLHYAKHRITGNNASFISRHIVIAGRVAADKCEVGAFDTKGNLVGAGTVVNGLTAFAIWGKDPMTRAKDGCELSETISFRLWDGRNEYPLAVTSGGVPTYGVNKILIATLAVPARALISSFNLPRVCPNPFRGSVKIAFDVPTIAGVSQHAIEINVYDLKGSLVKQIANGIYQAGHYALTWNCSGDREAAVGSSVYIVRMKAANFDKRLKLIRLRY